MSMRLSRTRALKILRLSKGHITSSSLRMASVRMTSLTARSRTFSTTPSKRPAESSFLESPEPAKPPFQKS